MYETGGAELDRRLDVLFDEAQVVGRSMRDGLRRDLKTKILRRSGRDVVDIIGTRGSGLDTVAEVVHRATVELMGRADEQHEVVLHARDSTSASERLRDALSQMDEGSLVVRGVGHLSEMERRAVSRVMDGRAPRTLVCMLRHDSPKAVGYDSARIALKPLHDREADIWELTAHFAEGAIADAGLHGCRGLSRQAKADIASAVKDTGVGSVRSLRRVIRDIVFDSALEAEAPLKLTSERVRPYLEREFHVDASKREAHDRELLSSQFAGALGSELLTHIAGLHNVSPDLLGRQAAILDEVIASMDDKPRSYRNIMERTETVLRAALWALSGAKTQAEFRRFFGRERFMVPTKSVAWAFYNRVFKRES